MAIFDLTIRGALHQGLSAGAGREAVMEYMPSDSLFAAMIEAWANTGVDVDSRLAAYPKVSAGGVYQPGEAPLCISSAFPRAGAVRFYPSPPVLPAHSGLVGPGSSGKQAKKIRWISAGILQALASGQIPQATHFWHGGSVWVTAAEHDQLLLAAELDDEGTPVLWKTDYPPRVAIDRVSSASNLFHTGRVLFARENGLWFAARGQAAWAREALRFLADAGLGGLRSTGNGAFHWTESETELPEAQDGWGYSLSRYAPAAEQEVRATLQALGSAYRLVTVGGWCRDVGGHAWRRSTVRLVAEGALFPAQPAAGALVDVRPSEVSPWPGPQGVYRCGLPFLIPAQRLVEAL